MSNLNEFDYGSSVRISTEFRVSNVLTDPATVSLTVTEPDGGTTNYTYPATISKQSTGIYYIERTCAETGHWLADWTSTTPASRDFWQFAIRRTGV